jgi:zinc protease
MHTLDRKTPPAIHNATEFDFVLPPISTANCKNGVPLYYINGGVQQVVSVEWIFDSGAWYVLESTVAQAAAGLLKSGTSTKTALQIDEHIEFYGGNLKVGCGNDWASVQLTCLSKHLHQLLPLVQELFDDAQFPQDEIDLYNQNYVQRLKVNLTKGDFIANRKIDEFLFGYQHPYGFYNTEHTIKSVTREKLLTYKNSFYSSKRCKIFLSGKFEDSIVQLLHTHFGDTTWGQQTDTHEVNHTIIAEPVLKHRIINDANAVQGAIRIARPFVNKQDPNFAQLILLNTIYGGYFGSRLMSNIREEKGYTYGIYSYIYNNKFDCAFSISTEAGKDVAELAVDEIFKEMELIKTEGIDEEELQLVKNYLLGNLLGDLDGPFQIIQRWKNLILNGFTIDKFHSNIATYKNCTTDELVALAQKYFDREKFYDLIVY